MKSRSKLLILSTVIGILSIIPLAFIGCSEKNTIEYGEWVTVSAPTCEEEGEMMRTALNDISITETRVIPATGHDWGEWNTTAEPTCLVAGTQARLCKTCGNSDMRPIPALGHQWGEWQTELEAACEHNGTKFRVCTRDVNHTQYEYIPALRHDFGEWVVTLAPTCTTGGVETRYCRNDNAHTEVRAVEAYGHNFNSSYVITKPATCTEDGEGMYICANDASHTTKVTVKALGHAYGDWVVSVPATESADGVDIRVCVHDCTHTETRVAPATGSYGLRYTLNAAGTEYSVEMDYPRPSGTVYIPAMHNGLPVTSLDSSAFFGCPDLERVVFIGNNLQEVGSTAFYHCDKLQSIEFPEGVTAIGVHAIMNCKNLKSVSLPSTVKYLGLTGGDHGNYISPVSDCPMLESITVAEGNETYKVDGGCLIEKATGALYVGTSAAVIPDYVTEIKRGAFFGSGLVSARIPASVSSIGQSAFQGCEKLKEVTFEDGELQTLGYNMYTIFGGCVSLERVKLPEGLTEIKGHAFSSCTSLKEVVIGGSLQTIGSYAFNACNAIEVCQIPASVTKIYGDSFTGAAVSALTIAEENAAYVKDGDCIIERATGTLVAGGNNAVIPAYVTAIGDYAFSKRNIKSIVIPSGVKSIGAYAFYDCASLESVTFERQSQLETIGENAFEKCIGLRGILLPEKLRVISSSAFYDCSALASVMFGFSDGSFIYGASALESIGAYAFNRTSLKSFEIPDTVTKIEENAFSYCEALTSLTVEEGNRSYQVISGCLFEVSTGKVLFALDGAVLPENTKIIGKGAFECCNNARLEIPASVTQVGFWAFYGWTAEQTIVVKGFASQEEAAAAWGEDWHDHCQAVIIYEV